MASGGDGYPNFTSRAATQDIMDQVLADYVDGELPPGISPAIQGRIKCVDPNPAARTTARPVLPDPPRIRGPAFGPARAGVLPDATAGDASDRLSRLCTVEASAHAPTTAIGRAVEAFGSVSVSYDPGAAVTDLEADRFNLIVDSSPKVAFMPASASSELAGGPNVIAEEIAREADSTGRSSSSWARGWVRGATTSTTIVWPSSLATRGRGAGRSSSTVETLVRSVQAEPTSETPWGWIGAGLLVLAVAVLIVFDRVVRRRFSREDAP